MRKFGHATSIGCMFDLCAFLLPMDVVAVLLARMINGINKLQTHQVERSKYDVFANTIRF